VRKKRTKGEKMDALFIIGFLGLAFGGLIFAIIVSIRQKTCKHEDAWAQPDSISGNVIVSCNKCKKRILSDM